MISDGEGGTTCSNQIDGPLASRLNELMAFDIILLEPFLNGLENVLMITSVSGKYTVAQVLVA